MRILRSGWRPCPSSAATVHVSVTDFTASRLLDLPGIARAGYRLRGRWPSLPGAVGVWLWSVPAARRSGSVSLWTDPAALRGFVGLAEHREIMRRYRDRGTIRSHSWDSAYDLNAIWGKACRLLLDSPCVKLDDRP